LNAVAASVEELAFDLALDSLDLQRDVLKDVRARSTTLLTASSIVTSFVGGRAIDAVGLDALTATAIAAFFLTLVPAIHLLTTSGEARFSIEGAQLYSDLALAEASLDEAYAALADDIHEARRRNRPLVIRALWSLRIGFGALLLEVILFLAALAVH
jgi:cytochrome bd-type quinol oxidase subunit 1